MCSDNGTEIPMVPTRCDLKMINFSLREFDRSGSLGCPNLSFHFHRREFSRMAFGHPPSIQFAREFLKMSPVFLNIVFFGSGQFPVPAGSLQGKLPKMLLIIPY